MLVTWGSQMWACLYLGEVCMCVCACVRLCVNVFVCVCRERVHISGGREIRVSGWVLVVSGWQYFPLKIYMCGQGAFMGVCVVCFVKLS